MAIQEAVADTFPKLLLLHAQQRAQKPAIREKSRGIWRTLTWQQLSNDAAAIAFALSARGLKRGGYAALLGDNRPRLYTAMSAIHSLGAVAVPLFQDASAEELVAPIQSAKVTHVFAENQEQVDKILKILPQCPSISCIVYDKDRGMRHYRQPQLVSFSALVEEGAKTGNKDWLAKEVALGNGKDAAFLFQTSGTTGPAKNVLLTHDALIDRARIVASAENLSDSDVALAYLSPGWIGQNAFSYVQPMVVGYTVCCPESSDTMLTDMREIGPTYFLATPRVLDTLLTQVSLRAEDAGGINLALYRLCTRAAQRVASGNDASLADRIVSMLGGALIYGPMRDVLGMSKIRVAYAAGDAVGPQLQTYFRALGVNLKQLYGSTETGFIVALQRNGNVKPGAVGTAVDGVELKLTPEREILVRSPGLFKEYFGDQAATKSAVNADGWFHTGDAGYVGQDGELHIIDRMKNIGTLKNGSPFAPRAIENKLKFSSFIKEAIVFGNARDKVCALVDIDVSAVSRWADLQSITYTGYADLASREEVYDLISREISRVNAELASDPALAGCQVHRFAIIRKELNANDGLLTRTGKLRRHAIAEKYKALIDGMYEGSGEVHVADDSAHADAAISNIKISDATVSATAQSRKAA